MTLLRADILNATIATDGLSVRRRVPYGPTSRQAMDVWRPAGDAAGLPVVVFFYGGAWQNGRRQDYPFVAAPLARLGMVVAVADYRVFPQVRYPAFIEDGARAVATVRREAPAWGGDPDRVFVTGHSAGAYIAAMLALDPCWLAAAGEDRARLAGMVGLAGPYDFLPIQDEDIRAVFSAAADLRQTQPVAHVDGRNPPMLLLHGAADTTCYPRNTLALAARVRAAGGVAERRLYPGVGHIGIVIGMAPVFRFLAPVFRDFSGFVLVRMCPAAVATRSAPGYRLRPCNRSSICLVRDRSHPRHRRHRLCRFRRRPRLRRARPCAAPAGRAAAATGATSPGLDAETVEGDLTDPESLARAVAGCRFVVHVAADYRIWVPDPQAMLAANVEGTRTLMRAALQAGVERVVYCSSVAALGLTGDATPADERTPVIRAKIVGTYKQSKFDAERVVARSRGHRGPAGGHRQPRRPGRVRATSSRPRPGA